MKSKKQIQDRLNVIVQKSQPTIEDILQDYKPGDDYDLQDFEERQMEGKYVVQTHTALYELIYAFFKATNYTRAVNKSLRQKERLLNLRNQTRMITAAPNPSTEVVFDFKRLTEDERQKLINLFVKVGAEIPNELSNIS